MDNLNEFGKRHISTYLMDYSSGKISFTSVKNYLYVCFNRVDELVIYRLGFDDRINGRKYSVLNNPLLCSSSDRRIYTNGYSNASME